MKRAKAIGRTAARLVLEGLVRLAPLVPMPIALWLGRRIGDLLWLAARRRRRIADRNLRIAFGNEMSDRERARVVHQCFREWGMFGIEGMKFAFMSHAEAARRITWDPAQLDEVMELRKRGKGLLMVASHFGNFELAARLLAIHGMEVLVVVRAARDQGTTDLMTRMRERNGMTVVRRDQSLRPMLQALRRNACVALLSDQNAEELTVPFFGQPTGTVTGPAKIAIKTGAPIVTGYCIRVRPGRYYVGHHGIVEPIPGADEASEIMRITTEVNARIEKTIRSRPEQWLWIHDRWRSSPGAQPRA